MVASFFAPGGAAASGWTAYPPLSAVETAVPGSGMGQTLWILAMALFIVSFTMGGLNFIVTIFCLRAPGLSMSRLPLTVWSYLLSTILGVLAFPALTAVLLFDRHAGTSFYLPAGLVVAGEALANQGGTPLLWQHLFWFLGHPEVYVLILPAFTRKPVYAPKMTAWSYVGMSGLGGLFLGNATADIQLHDTYFVVGHFHLMIGGVTLLGLYAAIYFWFPKMFGRMLNEKLGKIHFWLTFVCYYTIFVFQHFVGLTGMPRRYYAFTDYDRANRRYRHRHRHRHIGAYG